MNLGEAKREYREVLEAFARLDEAVSEARLEDVQRRLDGVHKRAMRQIDQYTTRRFLSVNQRRGMVTKLDRLHQEAHAKVVAIAAERRGE
ncbi:hypothetical protein ACIBI3_03785 [Actinomadura luteofluorescens]|uniref:hypothetical protein n=1 Tax=Actinomadura luteofluorescens TaxID=46163 RepID=UPI003479AFA2